MTKETPIYFEENHTCLKCKLMIKTGTVGYKERIVSIF